ncbi:MAG: 5'/3'-nucleotidase SurE [Fibrobacterota bacterium]
MAPKRILLTNDDGYYAAGIQALYAALSPYYTINVIAPEKEQSGKSHSFTFTEGLRFTEVKRNGSTDYIVSGTPSDCVKLGLSYLLPTRPDYIISGINHGYNLGIAGFYSGTVGAAREGAFWRIPSLAFSTPCDENTSLDENAARAQAILKQLEEKRFFTPHRNIFYNVNFPRMHRDNNKIKICRQSLAYYSDNYDEKIENGEKVLYVKGRMVEIEEENTFDIWANKQGYTTITPLSIDSTCPITIEETKNIELY